MRHRVYARDLHWTMENSYILHARISPAFVHTVQCIDLSKNVTCSSLCSLLWKTPGNLVKQLQKIDPRFLSRSFTPGALI